MIVITDESVTVFAVPCQSRVYTRPSERQVRFKSNLEPAKHSKRVEHVRYSGRFCVCEDINKRTGNGMAQSIGRTLRR